MFFIEELCIFLEAPGTMLAAVWQLCAPEKKGEVIKYVDQLQRALYSFSMRYKGFMCSQFSASISQKKYF